MKVLAIYPNADGYGNIAPDRIAELYDNFTDYVNGTLPMPMEYQDSFPGADDAAPERGDLSLEVADLMKSY